MGLRRVWGLRVKLEGCGPKGGAQHFALFSSCLNFLSFFPRGSLRGILVVFLKAPENFALFP